MEEIPNFLATVVMPFKKPPISSNVVLKLKSFRSKYLPFGITKA